MADLKGRIIGNCRIEQRLGEGGMGEVYQAYDLSLQRSVAIKFIHPHLARLLHDRFIQEARAMAKLDHPGIVKVYMLGREGDQSYIRMELIKGDNLRQLLDRLIKEKKWLPLQEALLIMEQLCEILKYVHQQGVLHRDIKPANLMLKPEPTGGLSYQVVLTDLGLIKLVEGLDLTQEGTSLGTPAYMSPEQALGRETDARSDVYSLGILFYELAVKRLPFGEITSLNEAIRYHTQEQPPMPRSIRPELPEALEHVILKALEKEPDKRYSSAAGLKAALQGVMSFSAELIAQADLEATSLITAYQQSLVALPRPGAAGPGTVLENGSLPPRGLSVFGDQSIAPSKQTRIQVLEKDTTARIFTLQSDKVTIGRDEANEIRLNDKKASRKHAQVTWDGTDYQVRVMDLDSTNGTYLGNTRLLPGVPEIWELQQPLQIGDTWLRLLQPIEASNSVARSGISSPGYSRNESSSAGLVRVSVIPEQLAVEAGGSVSATVTLSNLSPKVEHFSVSLRGIPSAWVVSLPPTVQLMPGHQTETEFTLQIPREPSSRAGSYPLSLRVISHRDPSQSAEIKLTLKIAAYSQFQVELQPERPHDGQTARLTIYNHGNSPETFTVQFKDPADELMFNPPHTSVKVSEGGSAAAEYRAQTRQRKLLGGEKSHSFSAQISPANGEPQTIRGDLRSRGLIPVWVPPIILLLCCLSAVTVAKYGLPFFFPTPTLTPTLTASPQETSAPIPNTPTATPIILVSPSVAVALTPTETPTLTQTNTPTSTFTPTWTPTPTPTNTPTNTWTPTVTKFPPIDLHTLAPSARWSSNDNSDLPFGGPDTDARGFAMYINGVRLEDGTTPAKVLYTHPQWVDDGSIIGLYPLQFISVGGHFKAHIGFLANPDGSCSIGNVKFRLLYSEGGFPRQLGEWTKSCDGRLLNIDISVNDLAGKNVRLALHVHANGRSSDDWAVWVSPRIEY